MSKRKCIEIKNLPFRMPVQFTLILFLCIDVWELSEGPCWLLYGLVILAWGCWLVSFNDESIDIFKDRK